MKALIRILRNGEYVWEDVEYDYGTKSYVTKLGDSIWPVNILAIDGAKANEYVVCNNCGTKIKNDPVSIENHFAEQEAKANCLTCDKARPYDGYNRTYNITDEGNGQYKITETYNSKLRCVRSYQPVDSALSKHNCIYKLCRQRGTKAYDDILMQYPDLFETQITIDMLLKKKYKLSYEYANFFYYDMKCRNTLFAAVNQCGIVDHFVCKHNYCTNRFYYSSKYNKLFYTDCRTYTEGRPNGVTEAKYAQIQDKIITLYEEAKANE